MRNQQARASGAAQPPSWRDVAHIVCSEVDWSSIAAEALESDWLGALVGSSIAIIGNVLIAEARMAANGDAEPAVVVEEFGGANTPRDATSQPIPHETIEEPYAPPLPTTDAAVQAACDLLGITPDATEAEIRGALRARKSRDGTRRVWAITMTAHPARSILSSDPTGTFSKLEPKRLKVDPLPPPTRCLAPPGRASAALWTLPCPDIQTPARHCRSRIRAPRHLRRQRRRSAHRSLVQLLHDGQH